MHWHWLLLYSFRQWAMIVPGPIAYMAWNLKWKLEVVLLTWNYFHRSYSQR